MNILFTTSAAPEKSPFFTTEKRPPLGLGFLMAIVRNAGHKIFFIDNYLKPSNFIEDGFLQENDIDFVAIYSNTICYRDTARMFKEMQQLRVKSKWKGKIIVGGPHTSVALQTIPEYVDYIVQGEGEATILEIINGTAKTRVIRSERIKNLDSLPFPAWDIFAKLPYDFDCQWMDTKPVFTMNTSRGCPFGCTFCSVGSIWGKKYTYYGADRIISEIKYLIENFGAKGIYFREDNFTLNSKRVKEFCEKLIKNNIKIEWACETRVDNLTEEMVKLMNDAGCKAFYLGAESGSQRILKLLNKNITVDQIRNAVNLARKYNIHTYLSLIVGVPGETFEDYLLTEELMDELKPYSYSFNVFVGIPFSSLYQYVLENKIYEYKDDLDLLYLPGYNTKSKIFYGCPSSNLVDYDFKERTQYDLDLMRYHSKLRIRLKRLTNKVKRSIRLRRLTNKVKRSIRLRHSTKDVF